MWHSKRAILAHAVFLPLLYIVAVLAHEILTLADKYGLRAAIHALPSHIFQSMLLASTLSDTDVLYLALEAK